MPLVDHLEELRQRVLKSLIAILISSGFCLIFVRKLVQALEMPAGKIQFLQVAPGEFLFTSIKQEPKKFKHLKTKVNKRRL